MRCSQLETAFPGAVRERRDAAVVAVAATVEHHGRDAGLLGAPREQLADLARLGRLVTLGRGGYSYHGRIAALADGAREGGLKL